MTTKKAVRAVNPLQLWIVEWSPAQRCIHIDQLGEVLTHNCTTLLDRSGNGGLDFVPIGLFTTASKANKFARDFKVEMRKREKKT